MSRSTLYVLINLLFIAVVAVGSAINMGGGVHPLYVIVLFALCSTPIMDTTVLNGPYALLAVFSFYFFLMFGALDFHDLILGSDRIRPADGVLDMTEAVILVGGALVQVTYRAACRLLPNSSASLPPKDWPERTLIVVGITLWVVCNALDWEFAVHIIAEPTIDAVKRGLGSLNGIQIIIFLLARLAKPLAIIIIAYAQCRYRRSYMVSVVAGVIFYQLFFGFVIDFKTEALLGGALVVLTNFLVTARVPKFWVGLMLVVVAVAFPLLQANRVVRSEHGQSSTQVSENVFALFQRTVAAKERVNTGRERAQTALERLTLKGSVQIIVVGTGVTAPFKHGYTLTPLVTAFIPRLVWPDKPSVETGRILNKDFHLSESPDTYMSPSHLGELYWNFGWPGVIVGMGLIGLLLGLIGNKFNLYDATTITRLLVIVITVRYLILASEGELATHYVSWMRSLLGVGLLHLVFARVKWVARPGDEPGPASADPAQAVLRPWYPNILR
jgi:O-antigen polysaccharide polymerase Wzy